MTTSESPTHPDAPRAGGETPALDLDATLKPCPFCGGAPAEIAPVEINGKWVIECTDCAVNVVLDSRHYAPYRVTTLEQAIAAWNQRALLLARHRDGEREPLGVPRDAVQCDWCHAIFALEYATDDGLCTFCGGCTYALSVILATEAAGPSPERASK